MKNCLITIALLLTSSLAFAGSATHVANSALGFDLYMQITGGEDVTFMDKDQNVITFSWIGEKDDKLIFKEKKGRCTFTLKRFKQDFAEGKTKNDYMLHVEGLIIQVEQGEDACKLNSTFGGPRSLTGFYQ